MVVSWIRRLPERSVSPNPTFGNSSRSSPRCPPWPADPGFRGRSAAADQPRSTLGCYPSCLRHLFSRPRMSIFPATESRGNCLSPGCVDFGSAASCGGGLLVPEKIALPHKRQRRAFVGTPIVAIFFIFGGCYCWLEFAGAVECAVRCSLQDGAIARHAAL